MALTGGNDPAVRLNRYRTSAATWGDDFAVTVKGGI